MKFSYLVLYSILFLLSPMCGQASDFYLGGIQVNEADHDQWASTLKQVGMNTVEVTVYARQGDWDSENLWYKDLEEESGVIREIRAARAAGLKVTMVLRVLLDSYFPRNVFLWHGMIQPRTDSLTECWFQRYTHFATRWAEVAEKEGVEVLVIGSELNEMTSTRSVDEFPDLHDYYLRPQRQAFRRRRYLKFREEIEEKDLWVRGRENYQNLESYIDDHIAADEAWARTVTHVDSGNKKVRLGALNRKRRLLDAGWRDLVKEVRKIYRGQLSYAANFDNYQEVGFWDALDLIGINAYFPLRSAEEMEAERSADEAALTEKWAEVLNGIQEYCNLDPWAGEKPVIFTELGYSYRENCTVRPWEAAGFSIVGNWGAEKLLIWDEQKINREERALAVRALHTAVKQLNFPLRGILYWKLTTHDYHIPYEPFVLHIADPATDELQTALLRFLHGGEE